jgi:hypothetical protein
VPWEGGRELWRILLIRKRRHDTILKARESPEEYEIPV